MGSDFDSFDESALSAFIESALAARGFEEEILSTGFPRFIVSTGSNVIHLFDVDEFAVDKRLPQGWSIIISPYTYTYKTILHGGYLWVIGLGKIARYSGFGYWIEHPSMPSALSFADDLIVSGDGVLYFAGRDSEASPGNQRSRLAAWDEETDTISFIEPPRANNASSVIGGLLPGSTIPSTWNYVIDVDHDTISGAIQHNSSSFYFGGKEDRLIGEDEIPIGGLTFFRDAGGQNPVDGTLIGPLTGGAYGYKWSFLSQSGISFDYIGGASAPKIQAAIFAPEGQTERVWVGGTTQSYNSEHNVYDAVFGLLKLNSGIELDLITGNYDKNLNVFYGYPPTALSVFGDWILLAGYFLANNPIHADTGALLGGTYTLTTENLSVIIYAPTCQVVNGSIDSVDVGNSTFRLTIGEDFVERTSLSTVAFTVNSLAGLANESELPGFANVIVAEDLQYPGRLVVAGLNASVSFTASLSVIGGTGTVTQFTDADPKIIPLGGDIPAFAHHILVLDNNVEKPKLTDSTVEIAINTPLSVQMPNSGGPPDKWSLIQFADQPDYVFSEEWRLPVPFPVSAAKIFRVAINGVFIEVTGQTNTGNLTLALRDAAIASTDPLFTAVTWTRVGFDLIAVSSSAFEPTFWTDNNFDDTAFVRQTTGNATLMAGAAISTTGLITVPTVVKEGSNPRLFPVSTANAGGLSSKILSVVAVPNPIILDEGNEAHGEIGLGYSRDIWLAEGTKQHNADVTWEVLQGPIGSAINGNYDLADAQFTMPSQVDGVYSITVEATNITGTASYSWNVTVSDGRVAPIINDVADTNHASGGFYFQGIDLFEGTAPITWELVTGPSGMIIGTTTETSNLVFWSEPVIGVYTITVRATNDQGTDDETWQLTVT